MVTCEKEKIKSVACGGDTGNIHPSVSWQNSVEKQHSLKRFSGVQVVLNGLYEMHSTMKDRFCMKYSATNVKGVVAHYLFQQTGTMTRQ